MDGRLRSIAIGGCRVLLGLVLCWSAVGKIRQPEQFILAVSDYRLLGTDAVAIVAALLPWLELILAISLIAGLNLQSSFVVATLLLGAFALAQLSVLLRGLQGVSCGCSLSLNPSDDAVGLLSLTRTSVLAVVALIGAWCSTRCLFAEGPISTEQLRHAGS